MSADKRGRRSRHNDDDDKERRSDSNDRSRADRDGEKSSRRGARNDRDASNGRSSRRSGRDSRVRSSDRKSSRDDEQSSRNDRKSSRDEEQSSRNGRKSSRDDDRSSRNSRKSSKEDERSSKDGRKSNRDDEEGKGRPSRNDSDRRRTDQSTEETIEVNSILAEIAEETCRYGDCLMFLTEVVHARKYLNDKQRDMLWSSFRKRTSAKRNSWRKSLELERTSEKKETELSAAEYKNKLSKKIVANCKSVLALIDDYLLPYLDNTSRRDEKSDTEARIFYLKLQGDANRYMWEITEDREDKRRYEEEADKSYELAYEKAVKNIGPAKPLRLGLALNYAVLHFEVLNQKDKACSLAKKASDDAEREVDKLNKEDKMASESIIESLEHNIHIWKETRD